MTNQATIDSMALLNAMHQFGYLNSAQAACILADRSRHQSYPATLRLAQKRLQTLESTGLIRSKKRRFEAAVFGLTPAGCRYLGLPGSAAKDTLRTIGEHRILANSIAIDVASQYHKPSVWSEREIQTNRAPIRAWRGKIPDILIEHSHGQLTWVEVENSKRSDHDLHVALFWLTKLFTLTAHGHLLFDKLPSGENIAAVEFITPPGNEKAAADLYRRFLKAGHGYEIHGMPVPTFLQTLAREDCLRFNTAPEDLLIPYWM
jgi:hypothetical protein